jgi:hypothetical protein
MKSFENYLDVKFEDSTTDSFELFKSLISLRPQQRSTRTIPLTPIILARALKEEVIDR